MDEKSGISPNTDVNSSRELVTKLTRHETSDLNFLASRNRSRLIHKNTSVEFKGRGQVSREAGFTKSVEM